MSIPETLVRTLRDKAAAAANHFAQHNAQRDAAAQQHYVEGIEDVLDYLLGRGDAETLDRLRAHGVRGEEGPVGQSHTHRFGSQSWTHRHDATEVRSDLTFAEHGYFGHAEDARAGILGATEATPHE
jgi:hypothetical protein